MSHALMNFETLYAILILFAGMAMALFYFIHKWPVYKCQLKEWFAAYQVRRRKRTQEWLQKLNGR